MVMLAQAIAMESSIRNPKIILVTDQTDLDNQITGIFRKCGKFVENATTGQRLVDLLENLERYSDVINYKQYEGQIQKLIDTHITTEKIETITELVNIFDKDKFQLEVENIMGKAAKAEKHT